MGRRSYKSDDRARQTPERLVARQDLLHALETGQNRLGLQLQLGHAQRDAVRTDLRRRAGRRAVPVAGPPGANCAAPMGMQGTACRPGSMRWREAGIVTAQPATASATTTGDTAMTAPLRSARAARLLHSYRQRRAGRTGALVLLGAAKSTAPAFVRKPRPARGWEQDSAPFPEGPGCQTRPRPPTRADGPGVPVLALRRQAGRHNRRFLGAFVAATTDCHAFSGNPDHLFWRLAAAGADARAGQPFCAGAVRPAWLACAGMAVVLGLCVGLVVHTAAVALGLAAVFAARPWRSRRRSGVAPPIWLIWPGGFAGTGGGGQRRGARCCRRHGTQRAAHGGARHGDEPDQPQGAGVLSGLFAAVCRSRAWPGGVAWMVLGAVFILATLLVFGAIACFTGAFGALLQRSVRAQTVLNRVAGLVFLGLAVRLATAER